MTGINNPERYVINIFKKMLTKLDCVNDLAIEFETTLDGKNMGWFYDNRNRNSPVKPLYNSIKSWIGYEHNYVIPKMVFEIHFGDFISIGLLDGKQSKHQLILGLVIENDNNIINEDFTFYKDNNYVIYNWKQTPINNIKSITISTINGVTPPYLSDDKLVEYHRSLDIYPNPNYAPKLLKTIAVDFMSGASIKFRLKDNTYPAENLLIEFEGYNQTSGGIPQIHQINFITSRNNVIFTHPQMMEFKRVVIRNINGDDISPYLGSMFIDYHWDIEYTKLIIN